MYDDENILLLHVIFRFSVSSFLLMFQVGGYFGHYGALCFSIMRMVWSVFKPVNVQGLTSCVFGLSEQIL